MTCGCKYLETHSILHCVCKCSDVYFERLSFDGITFEINYAMMAVRDEAGEFVIKNNEVIREPVKISDWCSQNFLIPENHLVLPEEIQS